MPSRVKSIGLKHVLQGWVPEISAKALRRPCCRAACREVCTAAGLQPGQERTLKLCSQLLEGVKQDGKLDFEDFISVVYFKEIDDLLSAYGVHPDGHKD